ncbi:alkaline phosphatase family protein [Flavobacterium ajazii]|uniref:hypothetical protein n=1 Tax=Flavobacterium ajazii TaxID=2692318 RepID=UPI0013CFEE57|nr:hypothetical protein [Flavobacterium ajazii]
MKLDIRQKLNVFLNTSNPYPVLSGFSVGFYALAFHFSNNFDSVNSWEHLFFYTFYYILISITTIFVLNKILQKFKWDGFIPQFITILMLLLLSFYLFGVSNVLGSYKKIGLFLFLSFIVLAFKIKKNKHLAFFLFLMSAIPVYKLVKIVGLNLTNSTEWQNQPDNILMCKFRRNPNIYYIQPDGYANDINLKGPLYRHDNSMFDNWLKEEKFTLYNDYRSNYESTLFSNSSCFYMKHHFSNEFSNFEYARDYIVGENPVLKIFKSNNYKTFFITERAYLLSNRPNVFYDYCNFKCDEIPIYKDGWEIYKPIYEDIKNQIERNKKTNNFFFIEKFKPGHIGVYKKGNLGAEKERKEYIKKIKKANDWLKIMVSYIRKNDPNSIIIIGADHGGFVGFDYTLQAQDRITDPKLLYSIFGAKLAIKWNDGKHAEFDRQLKTPVNLFRVLFSYLSENKQLLKNLQPNTSYNCYDSSDFSKVYKAIDENGSSAFLNSMK